jgi:TonB-dependent SusC/RagA subfamily outer membrane receptor
MNLKRQKIIALFFVGCMFTLCISQDSYGQNSAVNEKVAISVGDTSAMGKINVISPDQLLRGRISGIRVSATDGNPLGAITTTLRGVNSLRGNSDPIWVVDGVILNSSQLEVNPMFWQANYQQKDYTSVQNTLATINPEDIETIKVLKDLSATAVYGTKGANGVIMITTKQARQKELKVSWSSNISLATSPSGTEMLNLSDYKTLQQQLGNASSSLSNPVNWTDEAVKGRTAISHNHYLSVSGTEKKLSYYLSGFYRQIEGVVAKNNSTLGGFRVNIDMNASELLSFGARIAFAYADINMTKGANPLGELSTITAIKSGIPDLKAINTFASWQSDYDDNSKEYRVIPSAYFALNLSDELKFNANFGLDYRGKDRSSWLGNSIPMGLANNGAASLSTLGAFSYNLNAVLSYQKSFNGHNLLATAGAEILSRNNTFNTMNGTDFFSHELRAKGINLASSKAQIRNYHVMNEQTGFFGTVSYDFEGKMGINGIFRSDRTGKQEDHYRQYPAISGWWNILKTNPKEDSKIISSLKVRTGWGTAGNNSVVPYDFLTNYYTGTKGVLTADLATYHSVFLRKLSTETSGGLDIGFLSDRIVISATYFDKTTEDRLILNSFGEVYGNNGFWRYARRKVVLDRMSKFSNKGIELDLSARILKGENWNWNLSVNGTSNKNNLERVDEGNAEGGNIGAGIYANYNQVGSPVSAIWGYRGPVVGTSAAKQVIGNPFPKFFGGLSSDLTYKRFSINILFDGASGFDILNLDRIMQENVYKTNNISLVSLKTVTNTNAAILPYLSDKYIEKGDYIRLSQLSLGYLFQVEKIKWVKSFRLTLSALNAFAFSAHSGWNPEINSYGFDNSRQGMAYGAYPESRYFTIGFNATF